MNWLKKPGFATWRILLLNSLYSPTDFCLTFSMACWERLRKALTLATYQTGHSSTIPKCTACGGHNGDIEWDKSVPCLVLWEMNPVHWIWDHSTEVTSCIDLAGATTQITGWLYTGFLLAPRQYCACLFKYTVYLRLTCMLIFTVLLAGRLMAFAHCLHKKVPFSSASWLVPTIPPQGDFIAGDGAVLTAGAGFTIITAWS